MGNTTNIRFKGFTDDWEQRKLGDIITEYKETVDSDCTLPILTSSKTEGVILQEEHFGRKQQHDITGYNILPRNYCTYRNRSDGVDFTFNINKCCDKGIISKFYPVFSGKNSDVFFLSLVLNNSEEVVREIAYTCTGTGQKVLSFLDLQKMKVRVPNFDEQKEIAAYFESLDHIITLHQRKCDETKKLKKYMLQKMFPQKNEKKPEIRFAGFTDDWEQRKLGTLCSLITKGTTPKDKSGNGEVNFVKVENIDTDNGEVTSMSKISVEEHEGYLKRSRLEENDILFSIAGTLGRVSVVKPSILPANTNQALAIIRTNEGYIPYLTTVLKGPAVEDFIRRNPTIGAQPNLSLEQVNNLDISYPEYDEQVKIGDYFALLDNLITLHQRKCDEIKEVKKFMLQNMFPQKG